MNAVLVHKKLIIAIPAAWHEQIEHAEFTNLAFSGDADADADAE
jgi:hypothetical protein